MQRVFAKASKTCGYRTPLHTHVVVPGEHLGEIAGRYGVRRSDLIRLNSSLESNANMLRVGQKIRVCPEIKSSVQLPPGKYHVVKNPNLSWGTGETVRLIQTAISSYRRTWRSSPKIHVGGT